MADETKILSGFFKGVPISVRTNNLQGGRRKAIKTFPSRDTQSVEDLGLIPRKYQLDIIISDKPTDDYFNYRDRLIAVLEESNAGVLIHPLYGRIDDVVAVTYSISENFDRFGSAIVVASFEIDNNTGIPQSSGNVVTQVAQSNSALQTAIGDNISGSFKVTPKFTGNFTAAVDKVNDILDAANESTAFIGETADNINEFNAEIGELSGKVNSLVSSPLLLASSITGLFESVAGLYESAGATYDTMLNFFDFGDDDSIISPTTAGRIERISNATILNTATTAGALGYAYESAPQLEFITVEDIDAVANELDEQYWKIQETDADISVKEALTELRLKALSALDDIRPNTADVLTVETLPTSARLLAFSYYGDDDLGQAIADQNGFTDVSFIEGEVEILTQ